MRHQEELTELHKKRGEVRMAALCLSSALHGSCGGEGGLVGRQPPWPHVASPALPTGMKQWERWEAFASTDKGASHRDHCTAPRPNAA